MFFKEATIFKTYATEKAATAYVARNFTNTAGITVEFSGGVWMVIAR